MATKTEQRRAELRDRLIEAAELRIAQNGLEQLRARDLARDAGCSLGAIYNVFEDLTAIKMTVNGRTFQRLGQSVQAAVKPGDPAQDRLIAMATAYLHFAEAEERLWQALFELNVPADGPVPDWYVQALTGLFGYILDPVAELFPRMTPTDHDLMTRALFSSVHGIVLLGLGNRISGVPRPMLEQMISTILRQIVT